MQVQEVFAVRQSPWMLSLQTCVINTPERVDRSQLAVDHPHNRARAASAAGVMGIEIVAAGANTCSGPKLSKLPRPIVRCAR